MRRPEMKWRKRHDAVGLARQRDLALLLFLSNVLVGAALAGVMACHDWWPDLTSTEWYVFGGFVAVSWLGLVVAAGFVEWLPEALPSLFPNGNQARRSSIPNGRVARHRMFFYYGGLAFNLLAIAFISELTGGLAESPFVALLIAFVLTGQQLSRFRMQAGVLFVAGLLAAAAMLHFESSFGEPHPPPPPELEIWAVMLALFTGGLLNFFEKSFNFMVKPLPPPSHARIYRDSDGAVWRVAFFHGFHRQDPVLFHPTPTTAVPPSPDGAEEQFRRYAEAMAREANWTGLDLKFREDGEGNVDVELTFDR